MSPTDAETVPVRPRCYRCLRPAAMCRCASMPVVPTRTRIVVLQHPHERTHPFGTARLVALCMPNAVVHTAYGGLAGVLHCEVPLPADAAVLYPHPDARDLAELPAGEHPSTLVVLDGTWAHARKLYRDNPWLQRLRHVRLHPSAPSRYRIRREPRADYVSTLEAITQALAIVEPEIRTEPLIDAFDQMIDQQVEHTATVPRHERHKHARQRPSRAVSPLLDDPRLVVAYAESSLPGGDTAAGRELVQWAAVRAVTGETFEAVLRPQHQGPSPYHLRHMGLTDADLAAGESPAAARARFLAFAGDGAPVAAWTSTTLDWGTPMLADDTPRTVLKTSYCNVRNMRASLLDDVVRREGLLTAAVACRGRAARRLGNALAVARWLQTRRAALALSAAR